MKGALTPQQESERLQALDSTWYCAKGIWDLAFFLNAAMPRYEVAQPKELGTSWKMSSTPSKQEVSAPDKETGLYKHLTCCSRARLCFSKWHLYAAIERRAASIDRFLLSVLLGPQRNLSTTPRDHEKLKITSCTMPNGMTSCNQTPCLFSLL